MITQNDTIAAIATGQNPCAIGIVRISGPQALTISEKCLDHKKKLRPRLMHYRHWLNPENKEPIDDVMVCYFPAPNSYTGEDTVEIYGHGGNVNMTQILESVLTLGARLAKPGEYTQRAFLNGRMDLSAAEAVMQIIHAQNEVECKEAHKQLSGSVARTVSELRQSLLNVLCIIEASIDFSAEEDLIPMPVEQIEKSANFVLKQLQKLKRAQENCRLQGYRVVLLGAPNSGKSSLFNEILGRDRAIVTPIQGTTTDTLEEHVQISSIPILLVDTAGLIHSQNIIEQLGVERTRQQAQQADYILWLLDCEKKLELPDEDILKILEEYARNSALIILFNKLDSGSSHKIDELRKMFLQTFNSQKFEKTPILGISVHSHQGIQELEKHIADNLKLRAQEQENVTLITSQRHLTLLEQATLAINSALSALHEGWPADCIAADLHDAADALAQITGVIVSDDILNTIFSQFCIGK